MTAEEVKKKLLRVRFGLYQISRELNIIDSLWHKLCTPRSPYWGYEQRSTAPNTFFSTMIDLLSEREKTVAKVYREVAAIEASLIAFGKIDPHGALCLDLRYIKGESYRDIANRINYSKSQAYKHVQQSLSNFSVFLDKKETNETKRNADS